VCRGKKEKGRRSLQGRGEGGRALYVREGRTGPKNKHGNWGTFFVVALLLAMKTMLHISSMTSSKETGKKNGKTDSDAWLKKLPPTAR